MLWVWLPELWAHWQIRLSETIQGWNISQRAQGLWQTLIKLISRIKFKALFKQRLFQVGFIEYSQVTKKNWPPEGGGRGRGVSEKRKRKKAKSKPWTMLTNTASAPLRRASVNPTRGRTMSVKSNTQLSRAGGVMEAWLVRGSAVLLEPMPRRKEREAGWYTFGSGEIHLRLPGSGLWAALGRDGGASRTG